MTDPSNPLTEPKRLPSRGKRAAAGLLATCLGIGAWALFFLINSLIHIRLLPLPVIGLILIAAGLYHVFARDDSGSATANQDQSQP